MTHALSKAIHIVGGQLKLAEQISAVIAPRKIYQSYVHNWLGSKKGVPAEYCAAIERATGGKITRQDLRPDLWPPSATAANTSTKPTQRRRAG